MELFTAALLAVGSVRPLASAAGALLAAGAFVVTWFFFFTTPGVVKWSLSPDPIA